VTLVEGAVESARQAAVAKQIELRTAFNPQRAVVEGDARRLQQVVWNLLTNAIKFTPAGGRVDLRLEPTNGHARIVVHDTGLGVAPDVLPHIFERFHQAATRARSHGGLGLGLAIVRHLVERHKGTVTADSAGEGRGATFTVTLPLAPAAPDAERLTPPAKPALADTSAEAPSLARTRVLLV
jgi:signal transduction histidine kinase